MNGAMTLAAILPCTSTPWVASLFHLIDVELQVQEDVVHCITFEGACSSTHSTSKQNPEAPQSNQAAVMVMQNWASHYALTIADATEQQKQHCNIAERIQHATACKKARCSIWAPLVHQSIKICIKIDRVDQSALFEIDQADTQLAE